MAGYQGSESCGGESGASVYRLECPDKPALYLKYGTGTVADDLSAEVDRLRWLASYVSVHEVLQFFYYADQAWLLTTALPGITAGQSLAASPGSRSDIVKAPRRVFLSRNFRLVPQLCRLPGPSPTSGTSPRGPDLAASALRTFSCCRRAGAALACRPLSRSGPSCSLSCCCCSDRSRWPGAAWACCSPSDH